MKGKTGQTPLEIFGGYCNFAQVPNGRKSSCRTEVPTSGNEDGKSWIEI